MSTYNFTSHEDRNFALIAIGACALIGVVGYVLVYYNAILPDQQMVDQMKKDIANNEKQDAKEMNLINTSTCNELKSGLNDGIFHIEHLRALEKYTGMCT